MTTDDALSPALTALLGSIPETVPIETRDVEFDSDGTAFVGFVARPTGEGPRPAVLLLPDWTGRNDTTRVRAMMLARLGYIAMAGDIYGGGEHVDQEHAPARAASFYRDPALLAQRVEANADHLRSLVDVDQRRIAVMGYCFGGAAALQFARGGAEVAGVVSFHGGLGTGLPATSGSIRTPLLVLTGTADPVVPDDAVVGFENELREAGADDWQIISYSGAMHAFTIPDMNAPDHGAAWNERADRRSWLAMRNFLDEVFA